MVPYRAPIYVALSILSIPVKCGHFKLTQVVVIGTDKFVIKAVSRFVWIIDLSPEMPQDQPVSACGSSRENCGWCSYLSWNDGGGYLLLCCYNNRGNISHSGLLHHGCHFSLKGCFLFLHVSFIFLCYQNITFNIMWASEYVISLSVLILTPEKIRTFLQIWSLLSYFSILLHFIAACLCTFLQQTGSGWDLAKLILGKDGVFSGIIRKGHRDLQPALSCLLLIGNFISDEEGEEEEKGILKTRQLSQEAAVFFSPTV